MRAEGCDWKHFGEDLQDAGQRLQKKLSPGETRRTARSASYGHRSLLYIQPQVLREAQASVL
ncbi:hypothetical protein PHMEG_00035090 [Phytophthora megakarya]|uniref:Uncharacterized protein n=1 Tax=Phytophthora megakarya TaxID=4795 RepID=A0A225UPI7_9STRA|nr:hypothetical protein PHMEG_00035090 [Phytophthora megakarya]